MAFWRRQNGLLFLDDGYKPHTCLHSNICNFECLASGTYWYKNFDNADADNSPYHNAIKIYMDYYTHALDIPHLLQIWKEMLYRSHN